MHIKVNTLIQMIRNLSAGRIGIGLVDQSLLSAANFILGILLIRYVSKEDYGLYVFAYSCIFLVLGFQNALITTQMTVISPRKDPQQAYRFSWNLCIGQYLYWLPLSAIVLISGWLAVSLGFLKASNLEIIIVTSFVTLAILLREFFRSLYFMNLKPHYVLAQDIFYVAILFALFMMFVFLSVNTLHVYALGAIGVAAVIISIATIYFWTKGRSREIDPSVLLLDLKECYANGKWSLLGVIVTWVQGYSYVVILSMMTGTQNTAEVHAARLLLMPFALLITSYGTTLRPQWAIARHQKRNEDIIKSSNMVLVFLSIFIIFYVALLYVAKDLVIRLLFTSRYADCSEYLLIWAVYFIVQVVRTNSSIILQVFESFKYLTVINVYSCVVTVLASYFLIHEYGNTGSLVAMILGEIVLAILYSRKAKRLILAEL